MLAALPCEKGKSDRKRGKTQTMEVMVITEQEVKNQRTMINDTIAIGWHVQWTPLTLKRRRQIKDDMFGQRDVRVCL